MKNLNVEPGAVKHTDRSTRRDPAARYARALGRHDAVERELSRAVNRWQKSRATLKRLEKKLDIEFAVKHEGTP